MQESPHLAELCYQVFYTEYFVLAEAETGLAEAETWLVMSTEVVVI